MSIQHRNPLQYPVGHAVGGGGGTEWSGMEQSVAMLMAKIQIVVLLMIEEQSVANHR